MPSFTAAAAPVVPVAVLPPSTLKPRNVMWSLFSTNRPVEKLLAPVVRNWSVLPVPTRVRPLRPLMMMPSSPPSR